MLYDELDASLSYRATRRAVVRTGAKLAYAAPLVAVTMKLSGGGALATPISGPGGGTTVSIDSYSTTCDPVVTDTGIDFVAGQSFTIAASGSMDFCGCGNPGCRTGPEGTGPGSWICGGSGTGSACGALNGQIGGGSAFYVGAGGTFTADASGRLILFINDLPCTYGDNCGVYSATITA